jgi:four helix bundle protein
MYQYSFERLGIWVKAKDLAKDIYAVTATFPAKEQFNLIGQMQRAAISVASNLAEGTSRNSGRDKARFSEIAYGSLMELLAQLIIAHELGFLSEEKYLETRQKIEVIGLGLNNLRTQQLSSVQEPDFPYGQSDA